MEVEGANVDEEEVGACQRSREDSRFGVQSSAKIGISSWLDLGKQFAITTLLLITN